MRCPTVRMPRASAIELTTERAVGSFSAAGWEASSVDAAAETQAILADQLPSLPLLTWPRLLVFAPDVCGPQADASVASLLWTIEAYDRGDECPAG